jgi:arsenical pump membrane protein
LNEGIAAVAGALAVLLLGTATPADVWRGLTETAGVLVFLLAMMVVATVVEQAGCFEWAAFRAVLLSRRSGRRLFVNLYLLGALVTLFLSLDVTAIMVAPLVCALVRRVRLAPLPFVLACAYVANTASLALPISNLTNMLVYSLLPIPFWAFARLMTLPNLAAMAVNLAAFFALFGRQIPAHFDLPSSPDDPAGSVGPRDTARLRTAAIGLGLVVVGLLAFGALGWPLYLPAVVGAAALVAVGHLRREITIRRVAAGVAWPLPLFVIGMYTVVAAAGRVGLSAAWTGLLTGATTSPSLDNLLAVAFGTAVGANLVNNLPMALVVIAGLRDATGPLTPAPAFASLIGTNVGPNVTFFGSLANLLVLSAARRYGIPVPTGAYLLTGLVTVPLMLLAATLVLWLLVR